MPANVLDLMVCHMATVNGLSKKASLVEGLKYHGMGHLAENEKEEMRNLAMRGGPYSDQRDGRPAKILRNGCNRPGTNSPTGQP